MCGGLQSGQNISLVSAYFKTQLQTDLMLECMRQLGHSELGAELSQNNGPAEQFPFNDYNLGRRVGGGTHPTSCI